MTSIVEDDFPQGHPKRCDYDPSSPAAKEWARVNIHPKGERDYPVDHPKAVDTKGNQNAVAVVPGVDPNHPELEAFTGRTPAQAAAAAAVLQQAAKAAKETPVRKPIDADRFQLALKAKCVELGVRELSADQYTNFLREMGVDTPQAGE